LTNTSFPVIPLVAGAPGSKIHQRPLFGVKQMIPDPHGETSDPGRHLADGIDVKDIRRPAESPRSRIATRRCRALFDRLPTCSSCFGSRKRCRRRWRQPKKASSVRSCHYNFRTKKRLIHRAPDARTAMRSWIGKWLREACYQAAWFRSWVVVACRGRARSSSSLMV
jgi:hypothetical protein